MDEKLFLKEFPNKIFSLSSPLWMKRNSPGEAIMQSWLIVGTEKVLVIDGPDPENLYMRTFIEETFKLPAVLVNTHGHIDHIGCNRQFDEVFIDKKDWSLLAGGGIYRAKESEKYENLPYKLRTLEEGQILSLGNRELIVYKVPGHTAGSVCLYEMETATMFSGDAIARRILYGMSDEVPLEEYLLALEKISRLEINAIYSMHDDFSLPKDMPQQIIEHIRKELPYADMEWDSPVDGRKFVRITTGGNEEDIKYFDMVIPKDMIRR